MTVGDRIQLTVTVEHDAGTQVVWPDSLDLGPFEVVGAERIPPVRDGSRVRTGVRFTVTAFELGDLELPAFEVSLLRDDGVDLGAVATESRSISVVSVGLDESGDIRTIKGPREIPRNWLLLLPWFLVACAMLAAVYWAYRRRQGRAVRGDAELVPVQVREPHEIAYEALDRLEQSGMLERGEIKAYFIEVSDIIRRYVEARYRVDALEMASFEVIIGLERAGVALETRLRFERFLDDCDLVKFAKWIPEMEACREAVPRARKMVDETKQVSAVARLHERADGVRQSGGGELAAADAGASDRAARRREQ